MDGLGKKPRRKKKTLAQRRKGKHCKHGFRKRSVKCRKTSRRRKSR